jgi:hypothetical protein
VSGPPAKPADVRRRRNVPAAAEWVDLPELDGPVLPELPARRGEREWHVETLKMWDGWRRDRATTQYTPADVA